LQRFGAFYIIILVQQNYFSDLHQAKILDLSAKPFFPYIYNMKLDKLNRRDAKCNAVQIWIFNGMISPLVIIQMTRNNTVSFNVTRKIT